MKALMFEGLNELAIRDIPAPVIDPEYGIKLKVEACAICGSDIRIYRHGNNRVNPPQVIGHEIAGEIVEIGKSVKRFKVGDRIAVGADIPCGECNYCREGHGNECQTNYAIGYQFQGGFAEYMPLNQVTVQHGPVHKIPEGLDYDTAALAEPLGCCINGLELSPVHLGDTVVIIGAGPIGCFLVQLSRCMGAAKIILADRVKARLEQAKQFGADICVATGEEDLRERIKAETEGLGAHVAIVACASLEAQQDAFSLVRSRGTVNLFGGLPATAAPLKILSNNIHYNELFVVGTHGSLPRHHRVAIDLIASKRIDAKSLISHTFGLEDYGKAFAIAEAKESLKVILKP
jgi:L-iditol 2-dehydrogenase